MIAKAAAIIVLLILLLIFAIQNTQPVVHNFLFRQISPSVLYILASFMIGLLTGCVLMIVWRKKKNPRLDYSFSNVWQFLFAQ